MVAVPAILRLGKAAVSANGLSIVLFLVVAGRGFLFNCLLHRIGIQGAA